MQRVENNLTGALISIQIDDFRFSIRTKNKKHNNKKWKKFVFAFPPELCSFCGTLNVWPWWRDLSCIFSGKDQDKLDHCCWDWFGPKVQDLVLCIAGRNYLPLTISVIKTRVMSLFKASLIELKCFLCS